MPGAGEAVTAHRPAHRHDGQDQDGQDEHPEDHVERRAHAGRSGASLVVPGGTPGPVTSMRSQITGGTPLIPVAGAIFRDRWGLSGRSEVSTHPWCTVGLCQEKTCGGGPQA